MSIKRQTDILRPILGLVFASTMAFSAQATVFEDVRFDDAIGTAIESVVNIGNPGNLFDVDADNTGVVTNGLGQLDANTKNNIAFGTNYLDTIAITTGRIFGVMELTWDFQSVFDGDEPEQVRLSMINQDPRNTEITAEFRIERTASGPVINGQTGGTGATDIANVTLNGGSLTQTDTFIAVIDANLDTDIYEILYSSDDGATFLSAGTGMMDPARGIESLRMALNNDLVNDNILIDRVYLTDVNPITSIDALTLEIDPITGIMEIQNNTSTTFDINSYRIATEVPSGGGEETIVFGYRDASSGAISEGTVSFVSSPVAGDFDKDLNTVSWSSLSDNSTDAVDGLDAGTTLGDGIGETWDEAGGSNPNVLAESFLLGSSVFGPGRTESLGSAYQQDVDGADFLAWQRNDATSAGLTDWQNAYGSPLAAVSSVPEPSSAFMVIGMSIGLLTRRKDHAN